MSLTPSETDKIVSHPMFLNDLAGKWKQYREAIIGRYLDKSDVRDFREMWETGTAFSSQLMLALSSETNELSKDEKIRFCKAYLALGGVKPFLCGPMPEMRKRSLIVANHVSIYDAFVINVALDQVVRPVVVYSGEFAHEMLKHANPIYLCKGKSKEQLHEEIERELGDQPIVIFPESGTSNNTCVIEFATLPFAHKAVYVPVTVLYKKRPVALMNNKRYLENLAPKFSQEVQVIFHDSVDNTNLQWSAHDLKAKCFNSICFPESGLKPCPHLNHKMVAQLKKEIFRVHANQAHEPSPTKHDQIFQ